MEVASVNATASVNTASKAGEAAIDATLDYQSFLRLLVAQMKNQDPTSPMDPTEQISQLATFSQLEQSIQTNLHLEEMLATSALSQANAVIGRPISSADGETSGIAQQVKLTSDGLVAILEGGEEVAIGAGVVIG